MYRFNIRFDPDDASAQQAANYLLSLRHGNRNRFVIEAILAQIPGEEHVALMEELRQIIREEIQSIPVSSLTVNVASTATAAGTAPEDQNENDKAVLEDLALFE